VTWAAVAFLISLIFISVILILQGINSNELFIEEKSKENLKNILKALKI
jgi:hypothetical protein